MWWVSQDKFEPYQFALAVGGLSTVVGSLANSPLFVGVVTTLLALIARHFLDKAARSASDKETKELVEAAELKGFLEGREFERFRILGEVKKNHESK